MAAKEEIIEELQKFMTKLQNEEYSRHVRGWNKTMQYYFTDTNEYYSIKLVNGVPQGLSQGQVEKPEISYQMNSDDYLALSRGEIKGLKLYNSGRLKIKASMPDIIKLQKLE
ncbi:MAG: SCP2 sterol-binding domain-containing protein [Candidatus Thorarchaeota archaeon]